MATSNTTIFTVTRNDIVSAALRSLGILAAGETASTEDFTNCTFALNLILKRLATKGYMPWVYQTVSIPLVVGTQSYTIAPSGADITANRPLRIAQGWYLDPNNNRTPLNQVSRQEFNMFTPSTNPGLINSFYYEQSIGTSAVQTGRVYFWPVMNLSGYTAQLSFERQIQDISGATENFDVPQDSFDALRWLLADHVGPEYTSNLQKLAMIQERAMRAESEMADWNREDTSVYFQVSPQRSGYAL